MCIHEFYQITCIHCASFHPSLAHGIQWFKSHETSQKTGAFKILTRSNKFQHYGSILHISKKYLLFMVSNGRDYAWIRTPLANHKYQSQGENIGLISKL